jgi:hypothetical protein
MPELLTFVETTVFTKRVAALGLEESLQGLQLELIDNPEAGDVDPGTGGLRKIRLGDPTRGKGKRGGARVHYLWLPHRSRIYLMLVYGKNEASTLTADQKKELRTVVTQIKATDAPKERTNEGRNVY